MKKFCVGSGFSRLLITLVGFVSAQWGHAQETTTVTLMMGGEKIALQVSPSEVFATVQAPNRRVTADLLGQLQTKALTKMGTRADGTWRLNAPKLSVPLPATGRFSGGVIVPRAPGVPWGETRSLLAGPEESAQPVYLYEGRRLIATGTITVRFKSHPTSAILSSIRERFRAAEVISEPGLGSAVQLRLERGPEFDPVATCNALAGRDDVAWAEPDFAFQPNLAGLVPNDPLFPKQWYLDSIGMLNAWDQAAGRTAKSVTVAVLDDGVDSRHPDLTGKLVKGYDFVDRDPAPDPDPTSGHGTACAGIISAVGHNQLGIAGVAPAARIMPIRISNSSGFVVDDDLARAIRYAADNGAAIISCSWGGGPPSSKIVEAIDDASDRQQALVIAAAGNSGNTATVAFPARYPRCFAIGALNKQDTLWRYSSHGSNRDVDLTAPSGDVNLRGDIWTTDVSGKVGYNPGGPAGEEPSGDYTGKFGGTSAAAPVVAGVAAWLWSLDPHPSGAKIRDLLEKSAEQVDLPGASYGPDGRSPKYGFGKVSPVKALARLFPPGPNPTPGPNAQTPAAPAATPANGSGGSISYTAGGEQVELQPDATQVALLFESGNGANSADVGRLESLLREMAPGLRPASSQGRQVWVVPKARLDAKVFQSLAATTRAPLALAPVYRTSGNGGELVVATGEVTVRPNDAAAAGELRKVFKAAGATVQENSDGTLRLGFDKNGQPGEVARLLQMANESRLTRWAEPDLIRSIR